MRPDRHKGTRFGRLVLGLVALALASCQQGVAPGGGASSAGPQAASVRTVAEQRAGEQAHREILARFGGAYRDARLAAYVEGVGRRLAAVTEQPGAPWSFTVLDNPTINAFAAPGGHVYVTRGLVGLAEDEAQLAGVIGHEMGHVVAGHALVRRDRVASTSLGLLAGALGLSVLGVDPNVAGALMDAGQVAAGGYLAAHSRGDELEADRRGIGYLARAGYDPQAQAEFLDRLRAWNELQARVAGQAYDPNRVDFFASHPATAERTRAAIETARAAGAFGSERGGEGFLAAIDGIVWGDSARQGFVRGRSFSHTELGFTFTVPPGFTIRNASDRVTATGPRDARFIFDAGRDPGGPLTGYIAQRWAPAVARTVRTGRLSGPRAERVNGLDAALGVLPVELGGRAFEALLVAIRLDGVIYRITGLASRGSGVLPALADAASSFRRLSPAEAAGLTERRIRVVTVAPGDTVEGLARRMQVDGHYVERFRVLNGLAPGQELRAGQRVKLVR